ncbi:MAG: tRNA1(Val) (adenine(37)-N6)-methyltransferase [Clostridiales bacterium]|nr:tRNA1(Val) (adenine(37)-N6)-methyltransferase [Clostridiales bacterium]
MIHHGERVDDLQFKGLKMIQDPKKFCFGMDAVLLSSFVELRKKEKVVDFGTGTGIIPLLLHGRFPEATFTAFEIQKDMADMARRTVAMNGLENSIYIVNEDLRKAPQILSHLSQNVVVCNPPYGKKGTTIPSQTNSVALARHETDCTLAQLLKSAQLLLKGHGRLYMVFPANRMLELTEGMRQEKIEPKRLRFVYPKATKAPYLLLVEGVKGAKVGLKWEKPLIVYDDRGEETEEIRKIYHKE